MKAYFMSDLHLGAPYFDDSKQAEKRVVAFLDRIKNDADALFLLGDILDYWYEYRYVVPRGFVRFFGKLAELADRGIRIVWYIGNHDIWIFDYLPNELGIEVVDGGVVQELDGRKFYMAHGDGLGKVNPRFGMLRALFRNKVCQKLFSGIHPRWTVPFASAWSRHSRGEGLPTKEVAGRMVANLREYSQQYLGEHPDIDYFIYGHLHVLLDEPIPPHSRMIVLGEWLRTFSYAVWDGRDLRLECYREVSVK